MKNAYITVDVDTVSTVLNAHGITSNKFKDPTYTKVLPRFDSFFKKHKVKATFFVVGDNLNTKESKAMVQTLYSHGHEIANHSYSHPTNFSSLSKKQKEKEITKTEITIKDCIGIKPRGFRTPSWDISEETMQILEKKKYLYDSSILPTWVSRAFKYYLQLQSHSTHSIGKTEYALAPRNPYRPDKKALWKKGNMKIIEIPITTEPLLRLPLIGTVVFTLGNPYFSLSYNMARLSSVPLNFQLHAIELFDPEKDINRKYTNQIKHAPTTKPLSEKLKVYEKIISQISKEHDFKTLKELAKESQAL